jgi:uridylate kinase
MSDHTNAKNHTLKYQNVLIKISGESLMGQSGYGIDVATVDRIIEEIVSVYETGIKVSLVVGGGNIFRGVAGASQGMNRATADYMGMLATVINALALQNMLEQKGVPVHVASGIAMPSVCPSYYRRECLDRLNNRRVVIFAAGSGNPFFTTDTAAALRASEMGCDVILKATQVAGVYDKDPRKNTTAKKFDSISYADVLSKNLKVMDAAAISLARDSHIPIIVCSIQKPGLFREILQGEGEYTIIHDKGDF